MWDRRDFLWADGVYDGAQRRGYLLSVVVQTPRHHYRFDIIRGLLRLGGRGHMGQNASDESSP